MQQFRAEILRRSFRIKEKNKCYLISFENI